MAAASLVLVKDVSFPSDLPASTTALVPIADTPQASGMAGTPSDLPASTTAIVPIADTPQATGMAGTTSTPAPITTPAPYLSVSGCLHSRRDIRCIPVTYEAHVKTLLKLVAFLTTQCH